MHVLLVKSRDVAGHALYLCSRVTFERFINVTKTLKPLGDIHYLRSITSDLMAGIQFLVKNDRGHALNVS